MIYVLIGFLCGFAIPYLARRFSKFMPATPGYALYRIFKQNKKVSKEKRRNNHSYIALCRKYFMRSFGWAVTTTATVFLATLVLPPAEIPWASFFIISLYILMEIDRRMFLLPDIITVPLLISGFCYAVFAGGILGYDMEASAINSALGAASGYIIPVTASLFLIKKYPDAFGGGDIKLLAAVGAWMGLTNIPYVILLSCLIFAVSCYINKQKQGAFGPSIVISSLITLFIQTY